MPKEITRKARPSGQQEPVRMTVDLSPELYQMLESLAARTYLGSKATVFRHALAWFDKLVTTVEKGGVITIQQPGRPDLELDRVALAVNG
jgi:hypothetical protein